ncbi:MAG: Sensory box histidine kinase/response regulator [Myxococcales bacterium]|nr:Sensory box histidine kinase/response regulator [Myxococcales bacterium]
MLTSMFQEFLVTNRDEILARSRAKLTGRVAPIPTAAELENGLPLFLDQLVAILRSKRDERAEDQGDLSASATLHGGQLLRMGLTVAQVVQDYGSICQSVTELAGEHEVAITADEFHTFNHCLDEAIAQAVTEYQQQRDRTDGSPGVAQLGFLAHEMRSLVAASMLTFDALATGTVGVRGSTGAMLGRGLRQMRTLIDRTLAEVRLGADIRHPERVSVAEIIEEIAIVAVVDAKDHDMRFSVDAGPCDVIVVADYQILASVIANLVQNAFKFSHRDGHITLRAHATDHRALIDVQDECGGLPPGKAEELFRPFEQRGDDKTGLGLGLAISLKGARASGGEVRVRDLPGTGCVFTVDLPRAPAR